MVRETATSTAKRAKGGCCACVCRQCRRTVCRRRRKYRRQRRAVRAPRPRQLAVRFLVTLPLVALFLLALSGSPLWQRGTVTPKTVLDLFTAVTPGPTRTINFKTCTAFGPSRRLEFPGGEDHNIRAEGGGWGSERSPKVTPLPRPLPPSPGTVSAYGATTFSACGALDAGLFGGVRGVDNMHRVSRLRTWGFGGLLSACRGRLGAEQGIGRRKEPLCVRVHQGAYASHSGSHYARCKVQQGRSKDESGGGCKGDYVMCALPGLQCGWQDVVCSVP